MKCFAFFTIMLFLNWSAVVSQSKTLFVVNNLGETLSTVNLTTGTVENNIVVLGNSPNHMMISNGYGYVTNSTSADIYKINLGNITEVETFALPSGSNPWELLMDSQDKVYVSNWMGNSVSRINLTDGSVIDTVPTVTGPTGMIEQNGMIFVTNNGQYPSYTESQVSIIDPTTFSVTDSIKVPLNPQKIVAGQDGMLYVICTGDYVSVFGAVTVIDPTTKTAIDTIHTGGSPGHLTITPSGKLFIAGAGAGWSAGDDGYVFIYDTVSDTLLNGSDNPIITAAYASRIIADGDNAVYVSCFEDDQVQKLDATTGAVLATYDVGDGPLALALYSATVSSVEDEYDLSPEEFLLEQNYPNPFNPATTIRYRLNSSGPVRIAVYSVTGQEVTVLKNGTEAAGNHSVTFNGTGLASGVYFYTITVDGFTQTKKMMLMK